MMSSVINNGRWSGCQFAGQAGWIGECMSLAVSVSHWTVDLCQFVILAVAAGNVCSMCHPHKSPLLGVFIGLSDDLPPCNMGQCFCI